MGIYVNNIEVISDFYKNVFNMISVCENQEDANELLDELLDYANCKIITTKLITEQGKINGSGDMIEFVKILCGPVSENVCKNIFDCGSVHIAMGVDNIFEVSKKIEQYGGLMKTKIVEHSNGNKFAFAVDIEGNWIELIQRK